ncbi:MAG: DUF1523 family protein [Gemmobacter sp.]
MRWIKWTVIAVFALLVASVLHYTLPQRDIVRIVGVNTQRMDLGENAFFFSGPAVGAGTAADGTRDILFINTIRPNGRPMVYRNEDTGWIWPPYFKINSFSLQARASDLVSTEANPRWVAVTHYGWRNEFFTIFPNAIRLTEVEGPDVTLIPWLNIVILTLLGIGALTVWRMLAQFRERTIDPLLDAAGDAIDRGQARAEAARREARTMRGRVKAWLDTWRGKPRP